MSCQLVRGQYLIANQDGFNLWTVGILYQKLCDISWVSSN